MLRRGFSFLFVVVYNTPFSYGTDLGRFGHVFPIVEKSLLEHFKERLANSPELLEKQKSEFKRKSEAYVSSPPPVKGLKRAEQTRVFLYDPSITLTSDVKDQRGGLIVKAGQTVNPLHHRKLTKPLVFLDARDQKQRDWLKAQYYGKSCQIVLVAGSPGRIAKMMNHPCYFDQEGRITSKLGIKAVPAVLRQSGDMLEIEERALS